MTEEPKLLNLFLAVPGTDLGPSAKWKHPEHVLHFFEKARQAMEKKLGRAVVLQVEKERLQAGAIHTTMFRAAYEADVFIADLTGANPNVCLELGVRLALRRGVTLLVSQNSNEVPFDVKNLRVIQYANAPDDLAIGKIVSFVEQALAADDYCDSPVLEILDLQAVPRQQWIQVSGERVRRLCAAARQSESAEDKATLLREAVATDGLDSSARLALAREPRHQERYGEALQVLEAGIRLDPEQAALHLERGLVLGRKASMAGRGETMREAVAALRLAVRCDPSNPDALASLGGALRRLALMDAPHRCDWLMLQESAAQYQAALTLNRHDTYASLNLVRLGLLLGSSGEIQAPWDLDALMEKTYYLCAFETVDQPGDYWRVFDLADTLLFRGQAKKSTEQYARAIALVPESHRADVLRSPLSALRELVTVGALKGRIGTSGQRIIGTLESEISAHSRRQG